MENGVNWGNGFAIGDANTRAALKMPPFSRLMRKASLLLPLRQTFLSNQWKLVYSRISF